MTQAKSDRVQLILCALLATNLFGVIYDLFFVVMITAVREEVVVTQKTKPIKQFWDVILFTFCILNINGNIRRIDPSINLEEAKKSDELGGRNLISSKRGRRHTVLSLIYIALFNTYANYFLYYYASNELKRNGRSLNPIEMSRSFFKVITVMVQVSNSSITKYDLRVLLLAANSMFLILVVWLLSFQLRQIKERINKEQEKLTVPFGDDDEMRKALNTIWKKTILDIFGTKWYLIILFPYIKSPIPEETVYLLV